MSFRGTTRETHAVACSGESMTVGVSITPGLRYARLSCQDTPYRSLTQANLRLNP
jgi:hypothetical protein